MHGRNRIADSVSLSCNARLVLLDLYRRYRTDESDVPSFDDLTKALPLSLVQVDEAVTELVVFGYARRYMRAPGVVVELNDAGMYAATRSRDSHEVSEMCALAWRRFRVWLSEHLVVALITTIIAGVILARLGLR